MITCKQRITCITKVRLILDVFLVSSKSSSLSGMGFGLTTSSSIQWEQPGLLTAARGGLIEAWTLSPCSFVVLGLFLHCKIFTIFNFWNSQNFRSLRLRLDKAKFSVQKYWCPNWKILCLPHTLRHTTRLKIKITSNNKNKKKHNYSFAKWNLVKCMNW